MGRVARYELANTVSRLETAAADLEEAAASNLAIFKAARTEGTARAELARSRRARMLPRRKDLDKVTGGRPQTIGNKREPLAGG